MNNGTHPFRRGSSGRTRLPFHQRERFVSVVASSSLHRERYLSAGCLFIGVGGVANQQAVNMFVKRLIIRVARGLTAVPAAVKGQKA